MPIGPRRTDAGRPAASPHYALRKSGTTVGQLVKEIAQLAIGPGRLSPHEYMLYKLYDPGMAFARKAEYLGKRVQTAMEYPGHEESIERFCLPLFAKSGSDYAGDHVLGSFK